MCTRTASDFYGWQVNNVIGGQAGFATTGMMPGLEGSTPCGSSICKLAGLTSDTGDLNPAFSSGTDSYSLSLPEGTVSVNISASPGHPGALITGDGEVDLSGISPGSSKNIELKVTAEDGTVCVYTITVDIVTGFEPETPSRISIYPNPSTHNLNILNAREGILTVYNINGMQINRILVSGDRETIDLSSWVTGTYILKIQTSDLVRYFRFVRE